VALSARRVQDVGEINFSPTSANQCSRLGCGRFIAMDRFRPIATFLLHIQHICCIMCETMTSQEFKRWLQKQGCTFESGRGGHLIVRRGTAMSVIPMHGKQKELGTGLVNRIKKDLGLN
jgi:mRNA interferase HicA